MHNDGPAARGHLVVPSRCCHHGEGRSQDFLKNSKGARIEEYRWPSVSLVIGGSVATIAGAAHPAKPPKRLSHRPGWDAFRFGDCLVCCDVARRQRNRWQERLPQLLADQRRSQRLADSLGGRFPVGRRTAGEIRDTIRDTGVFVNSKNQVKSNLW